jgi:uncharacterized membrane protein
VDSNYSNKPKVSDATVERTSTLPAHVENAVNSTTQLQKNHHNSANPLHKFIEKLTDILARPSFTPILTILIIIWIGVNLWMDMNGKNAFDPPPFAYLAGLIALAALYMTGMILTTQTRDDKLTSQREQLTLELCIMTNQKIGKLIELMEKLRLDHPDLDNSVDEELKLCHLLLI